MKCWANVMWFGKQRKILLNNSIRSRILDIQGEIHKNILISKGDTL